MNKPLSEWTLGEVKAECKKHPDGCRAMGTDCILYGFYDSEQRCVVNRLTGGNAPCLWDLSEPPCWTDDEIEFAKMFKAACKNKIFFERLSGSQILVWGEEGIDPTPNAVLPSKLLPSKLLPHLKGGERITLDEIIGGGD